MLIQRLNNSLQKNPHFIDELIGHIKRHPGCCEEVWLSTEYGYPKRETHQLTAKVLTKTAALFRKNGIRVSLQVSNTLGHGQYMSSRDCSGLVFEGSDVKNMISYDGKTSEYSFCYNDRVFIDYIKSTLNEYAPLHPDIVWFDDDLRFMWHDPVYCGCFCDQCIAKFNKLHGSDYDRERLVIDIMNKPSVRKNYSDFMKESLGNFVEEICADFHKLSPESNFGHQNASITLATGGNAYIFNRMKKVTGLSPAFRPGGGAYNDARPGDILDKYVQISIGCAQLPEYVEYIAPEIENLPYTAYGSKSHCGTCFETSLYFAGGANRMSYAMLSENESMDYYAETLRMFSEHRKYWDMLVNLNRNTRQDGIGYVIPESSYGRNIESNESPTEYFSKWFDIHHYYEQVSNLLSTGLAVSFGNKAAKVKLLKSECAQCLTEKELEELLKEPCFCDAGAFIHLSKKYDCFNASAVVVSPSEGHKLKMVYTKDCMLPDLIGKTNIKGFLFHEFVKIIPKNDDYIALTKFAAPSEEPACSGEKYPFGIAECIVKTSRGGQWVIFGGNLWNPAINYDRKRFFEKLYEYLSGEKICVSISNKSPAVLLPRKNKDNKVSSVTILNASLDTLQPEIIIREPVGTKFFSIDESGIEYPLEALRTDPGYKLTLNKIPPWNLKTIIVK